MIDRCYIEITNVCNLHCDFCPGHTRAKRQLSLEEFDLLTDKIKGEVCFLYFHLMGEPLLHPLLPEFIAMARQKGFKTVLTSNGTLLARTIDLLHALPHKIQLSLHSHESNVHRLSLPDYVHQVMRFALQAAREGTCVVLRLWNQGGRDKENEALVSLLREHVPLPWTERPDGYRLRQNLYLEFDRKFRWPSLDEEADGAAATANQSTLSPRSTGGPQLFCKALSKQIGILADGSVVPCCLDHNGDVILGNLLGQQTLFDILSSPRARAMTEAFSHHTASEPFCRTCESALAHNSFRGKTRKSGDKKGNQLER